MRSAKPLPTDHPFREVQGGGTPWLRGLRGQQIAPGEDFKQPHQHHITMIQSLLYFLLAGLCEIGGGYLVWLWLREGRSFQIALLGWLLLIIYGVIPTLQPASFGRVYAAYGGAFVVLSLLWGWQIDGIKPDRLDGLGALIMLAGVAVIMYAPRS